MPLIFSIRTVIDCLQSVSTRLTVKKLVSYTKSNLSIGGFSREGKHDIVAPIFKIRNSVVNKEEFIPL